MYFIVYMYLVLAISQHYAVGSPVTHYEYVAELHMLLRLHIVPATWQDAGLRCYLEGGILASPTSSAMASTMMAMMETHKLSSRSVFTGIHDHSSKGEFVSVDGVHLDDMSLEWAEGQPDNVDNAEDCLALTGAGALADVSCDAVLPYFCRKEAPHNFDAGSSEMGPNAPELLHAIAPPTELFEMPTQDHDSEDEIGDLMPGLGRIYHLDSSYMPFDSATESEDNTGSADMSAVDTVSEPLENEFEDQNIFEISDVDGFGLEVINEPQIVRSDSSNIDRCAAHEGYEWEPSTDSCYKFHGNARSWYLALQTCHREGGQLAIINSWTESEALKEFFYRHYGLINLATNNGFVSIGVWKMIDLDTKWLTIHGDTLEEVGFDRWSDGEPNNWEEREHCGAMGLDGLLNDIPCGNHNNFPFICEITP